MLYLFIALIASLIILGGLNILQVIFHYREKEEIFNRYMAKTLGEYKYYKKEYPGLVKNQNETLKKKREEPISAQERKSKEIAKEF